MRRPWSLTAPHMDCDERQRAPPHAHQQPSRGPRRRTPPLPLPTYQAPTGSWGTAFAPWLAAGQAPTPSLSLTTLRQGKSRARRGGRAGGAVARGRGAVGERVNPSGQRGVSRCSMTNFFAASYRGRPLPRAGKVGTSRRTTIMKAITTQFPPAGRTSGEGRVIALFN